MEFCGESSCGHEAHSKCVRCARLLCPFHATEQLQSYGEWQWDDRIPTILHDGPLQFIKERPLRDAWFKTPGTLCPGCRFDACEPVSKYVIDFDLGFPAPDGYAPVDYILGTRRSLPACLERLKSQVLVDLVHTSQPEVRDPVTELWRAELLWVRDLIGKQLIERGEAQFVTDWLAHPMRTMTTIPVRMGTKRVKLVNENVYIGEDRHWYDVTKWSGGGSYNGMEWGADPKRYGKFEMTPRRFAELMHSLV